MLTREEAAAVLVKHKGNLTAAAVDAGMVRSTFTRLVRSGDKDMSDHARISFLRSRVSELEREKGKTVTQDGELLEQLHQILSAVKSIEPPRLRVGKLTQGPGAPCEMVVHLTDWHYGLVQDEDEIEGFNACSPAILTGRVDRLAAKLLQKVVTQRAGYCVPRLRVVVTGDMISGDIHDELRVTNAFPTPRQAVECGYLLGAFLCRMATMFDEVVVDIVTLDNHGRLTKKPQASQGGVNSWGYIVAEVANLRVANIQNIEVNIHACPSAVVTVGPEKYLCFHGHQIKAFSGIPYYSLDRRVALEAIKRIGRHDAEFTKLITGHLHNAFNGPHWMIGGSLTGTDTNDHNNGRHAPPHQTAWFVHPEHGEFDYTRWKL